jgi:glucose dehydrogenase
MGTPTQSTGQVTMNGPRASLPSAQNEGKIKWGCQYTPNDPYDFDEISEHPLIDEKINGVELRIDRRCS